MGGGGGVDWSVRQWRLEHGNGWSTSSAEDPHAVLGGVPELLRLANSGAHAELQEGTAARTHYQTSQLYGPGEEGLQRNEFGSHS